MVGSNEHEIRELVAQGAMTKSRGRAGYDMGLAVAEYCRYWKGLAKQVEKDGAWEPSQEQLELRTKAQDDLLVERARLAAEQAEKAALDNLERKGELMPTGVLQHYCAEIAGHVRAVLEALPAEMKAKIPHLRSDEVAVVRRVTAQCSDAIADFEPSHPSAA